MASIWVEEYGCSASQADSEMISGILSNGGHALASSPEDADASVIVTCSVKDATASRMARRIKDLSGGPLIVAGCLAEAEPKTVARLAKGASLMGPGSIGSALEIVNAALGGKKMSRLGGDTARIGLPKVRLNEAVGIVEIAGGCMSECTFCQTKLAKGDISSYRIGDIVRQVRAELDDGCKEVWLTSTDNGCYGLDIGTDLPELISAVTDVPGKYMVRVGMMNPMYMPRMLGRLLGAYSDPKVYKFLHVPVQSGSARVLSEMRRGHTAGTFLTAVRQFRERFGESTVSTDVIAGFPGETDAEFEETMRLISEARPDIVNVSRYSARPGTEAAGREQLDPAAIKARTKAVSEAAARISAAINKKWIGWKGSVLFSEQVNGQLRGRNAAYKPIFIDDGAKIGDICTVRVTGATTHSLKGEIAG